MLTIWRTRNKNISPRCGVEEQPHWRLDRVTWNFWDINLALVELGLLLEHSLNLDFELMVSIFLTIED